MAVMHHPFDSSSLNGPTPSLRDLWELMYSLGGDLVVTGHDHVYERHAPINADQRRDDARGIRQFTVGTGGAPLYGRVRSAAQFGGAAWRTAACCDSSSIPRSTNGSSWT